MHKKIYSNSPWEKKTAYCRALRNGNFIFISGTTAVDENGNVIGVGDMYTQASYVIRKVKTALKELGADMHHVVRDRMYITDMKQLDAVMRAHHEFFQGIDPASTCVAVAELAHPDSMFEIDVDAIVCD